MTVSTGIKTTATWTLYIFVVLEFLFMITPFLAFSWYPAYGSLLGELNRSRWTAGLNSFFLPHFSLTFDPVLNLLPVIGRYTAGIGLLLFVVGAVQIYSAKLLRRLEVTGGLYRFARHPQYAALMVLGFGLLLWWPRFLVLYAFVTMIFLYLALARHEEKLCLDRYGDGYRDYRETVGMFGPKWLSIARFVPARLHSIPPVLAYLLSLAFAGVLGLALREHALGQLSAVYRPTDVITSPALLSRDELDAARALALGDARVRQAITAAGADRVISYVVPDQWYMPDLPIDQPEAVMRGGHGTPAQFDRALLQVLVAAPRSHNANAGGEGILRSAHGLDPLIVANLDMRARRVVSVTQPPHHVVWGDIPMPLF